jgi:hypothetical protein
MVKIVSALVAAALALSSLSAVACTGDKAKPDQQTSTPAKPKV